MENSKHTPGPWKWQDRYNFHEHLEHQKLGLESNCENIKAGRIQLVNEKGSVVLQEWADYADDAGLTVSNPDARLIAAAPDMLGALDRICNASMSQFANLTEMAQQMKDWADEARKKARP